MRFWPLLAANLGRRKLRLLLTLGSFAVALFLFGLLLAIRGAFQQGVEVAGADRLVTINRVSLIQPLPRAHRDRIAALPGVAGVTFATWFGGVYQDPKNFFPQFAVDASTFGPMYPEFVIDEAGWRAFLDDRQGCVAGAAIARRFGWKVGDRVPLQGTIFPGAWDFNLRAIYHGRRPNDDQTQFWFHDQYLDERAPEWHHGTVGWYVVRVERPERAVAVARAVDERFANSPWETRTQTEKAFAASFVKQMGNVERLMLAVGAIVFVTLLLVTGNTMAMAVRERTAELAVLKALGFGDRAVLALVLAESALLALAGGGLGLAAAKAFTLGPDPSNGLLGVFYLSGPALAAGLGLSLAVGLLAGLLPALGAMRLRVVEALRKV